MSDHRSSRYIPLNNLHPVLKDLYSTTSTLSSKLNVDTGISENERDNDEHEQVLQNVDYIKGNQFPRHYNRRTKKKVKNAANKIVEEVIRLALEKLNSDQNSDVEEFFDAEENTALDDHNNQIQITVNQQLSTGVVSHASQTDLILDPNEFLEIVGTSDAPNDPNEDAIYQNEQGGTGDMVRREKHCKVTTVCEQCDIYMLNCYKYQCKCENLSVYSSTLEKKVADYVALLNSYNTRLMTSRLLIKQSNGKQNELMLRCDELQEKIRLHQRLKQIEYRKSQELRMKNKDYYVDKFSKDFYDIIDKTQVDDSDLTVIKEIVEEDKFKDTFDRYKPLDELAWDQLPIDKLATTLEDLEALERTENIRPQVESSVYIHGKDNILGISNEEAMDIYGDLVERVISKAEINDVFERYKSIGSIDWENLPGDRFRMSLKELQVLEDTEKIRPFTERELSDRESHESVENIISKESIDDLEVSEKHLFDDEQYQSEKLVADGSKVSETKMTDLDIRGRHLASDGYEPVVKKEEESDTNGYRQPVSYESGRLSTDERGKTGAVMDSGIIDEEKLGKPISEKEHYQKADVEERKIHDADKYGEVSSESSRVPAEGTKMTDVSEDDKIKEKQESLSKEKLKAAEMYTEQKIDGESLPYYLEDGMMRTGEPKKPEQLVLKESDGAIQGELKENIVPEEKQTREDERKLDDDKIGISEGHVGENVITKQMDDRNEIGSEELVRKKLDELESSDTKKPIKEDTAKPTDGYAGKLDEQAKHGPDDMKRSDVDKIMSREKLPIDDKAGMHVSEKQGIKEPTPESKPIMDKKERDSTDDRDGKLDTPVQKDRIPEKVETMTDHKADELLDGKSSTGARPGEEQKVIAQKEKEIEKPTKDKLDELQDGKTLTGAKPGEELKVTTQEGKGVTKTMEDDKQDGLKDGKPLTETKPREEKPLTETKPGDELKVTPQKGKEIKEPIEDELLDKKPLFGHKAGEGVTAQKGKEIEKAIKDESLDGKPLTDALPGQPELTTQKGKEIEKPMKDDTEGGLLDGKQLIEPKPGEEQKVTTQKDKEIEKLLKDELLDGKTSTEAKPTEEQKVTTQKEKEIEKLLKDELLDGRTGEQKDSTQKEKGIEKPMEDVKAGDLLDGKPLTEAKPGEELKVTTQDGKGIEETMKDDKPEGLKDGKPSTEAKPGEDQKITAQKGKETEKTMKDDKEGELSNVKPLTEVKPGDEQKEKKEKETEKPKKDGKADEVLHGKPSTEAKPGEDQKVTAQKGKETEKPMKDDKAGELSSMKPLTEIQPGEEQKVTTREGEKTGKPMKDDKADELSDKKPLIGAEPGEELKVTTQDSKGVEKTMKDGLEPDGLKDGKPSTEVKPGEEQKVTTQKGKETEIPIKDEKADELSDGKPLTGAKPGEELKVTTEKGKETEKPIKDELSDGKPLIEAKPGEEQKVTTQKGKETEIPIKDEKAGELSDGKPSTGAKPGEELKVTTEKGKETEKPIKDELSDGKPLIEVKPGEEQKATTQKGKETEIPIKDGKAGELLDGKPLTGAELGEELKVTTQKGKETEKPIKDELSDGKPLIEVKPGEEQNVTSQKGKELDKTMKDVKADELSDGKPLTGAKTGEDQKVTTQKDKVAEKTMKDNLADDLLDGKPSTGAKAGEDQKVSQKKPIEITGKADELSDGKPSTGAKAGEDQKVTTQKEKGAERTTKDNLADDLLDGKPSTGAKTGEDQKVSQKKPIEITGEGKKSDQQVKDATMLGDKNVLDATVPEKTELKKQVKQDVQESVIEKAPEVEKNKKLSTGGAADSSMKKQTLQDAERADYIEAKGKADDSISQLVVPDSIAAEKQVHPEKDKTPELRQDKQLVESSKQEGAGKEEIKQDKKETYSEKKETPAADEKDSKMASSQIKKDGAPVSQENDKLKPVDLRGKKSVDKNEDSNKIETVPDHTKKDTKQDKSDILSQEAKMPEKLAEQGKPPGSETVLDSKKEKMEKPEAGQMIPGDIKAGPKSEKEDFTSSDGFDTLGKSKQQSSKTDLVEKDKSEKLPTTGTSKSAKESTKTVDNLVYNKTDNALDDKLLASGKDIKPLKVESKVDPLENMQQDKIRTQEVASKDKKSKSFKGKQELTDTGKPGTRISTIDPKRSSLKSGKVVRSTDESIREGVVQKDFANKEKDRLNEEIIDGFIPATSTRVGKEIGHVDRPMKKSDSNLIKKEEGKDDKPIGKSDKHSIKKEQGKKQGHVDIPIRKSDSQPIKRGDQNVSRKSRNEKQLQDKITRVSKDKGLPDYSKGEARVSRKQEESRAIRQQKSSPQVSKDGKSKVVDPKLKRSASQKLDIAAINGSLKKKGALSSDSQEIKLKSSQTQSSPDSGAQMLEKWKSKPTLLEKMKKYGINVLTWDELEKLHGEVLTAMRAHHGLTDSESNEADIQNELQKLSPEDLGNLHTELNEFAENKKSRKKPIQSISKSRILTQLIGSRTPLEQDSLYSTASKKKLIDNTTLKTMMPEAGKMGTHTDYTQAMQIKLGAPMAKDKIATTSRAQNIIEPITNGTRLAIQTPDGTILEKIGPYTPSVTMQRKLGAPLAKDKTDKTSRAQNIIESKTNGSRLGIQTPDGIILEEIVPYTPSVAMQRKLGAPLAKDKTDKTSRVQNINESKINGSRLGIQTPDGIILEEIVPYTPSAAMQRKLGAPLAKDKTDKTSRVQNINESKINGTRLEIPLRQRTDIQGRRSSNIQDKTVGQKRGKIIEILQQLMDEQPFVEKARQMKKPSRECHCTPQHGNIVKTCFCTH